MIRFSSSQVCGSKSALSKASCCLSVSVNGNGAAICSPGEVSISGSDREGQIGEDFLKEYTKLGGMFDSCQIFGTSEPALPRSKIFLGVSGRVGDGEPNLAPLPPLLRLCHYTKRGVN